MARVAPKPPGIDYRSGRPGHAGRFTRALGTAATFTVQKSRAGNHESGAAAYAALSQQFLGAIQWLNGVVNFPVSYFHIRWVAGCPHPHRVRAAHLPAVLDAERNAQALVADKAGFALLAVIVISTLYIVLMTWFLGPQNSLTGAFNNFSQQGIVPMAFAMFDFSVALAVGTWSRRSSVGVIAAVVLCVAAVTAAMPVLSQGLPLHYLTPLEEVYTFHHTYPILGTKYNHKPYCGPAGRILGSQSTLHRRIG